MVASYFEKNCSHANAINKDYNKTAPLEEEDRTLPCITQYLRCK